MNPLVRILISAVLCIGLVGSDSSAEAASKKMTKAQIVACAKKFNIDVNGDKPFSPASNPAEGECSPRKINGFPVPDPKCTPGAVNPTLTLKVLLASGFKTGCVRDQATSAKEKASTYDAYGANHPENNTGQNQVCELDHLVSLELGGADTLDNIWPQCGPNRAVLKNRYFKRKDTVENYLAWLVKNDRMDLDEAQHGIAKDWTQYLEKAEQACPGGRCDDDNLPPPRHEGGR